ncbi:MAG: MFS transporter [Hyphomicrobiaceae bacterium]|nr:MAG: MFS transporter [Hyphomicrobiaceae bacterium]
MKSAIASLSWGNFLIGTGAFVVAGLTPYIAGELDVTIAAAGQLLTAYTLTYALTSPVLITFTSGIERRVGLAAGLATFAAGNLIVAFSGSFAALCIGRIMTALGAALFSPLSYALAAELSPPEKRAQILSYVVMGLTLANVVGLPLGTMLGTFGSWRWAFAAVGVLGLATAALLLVVLPRAQPGAPRSLAAVAEALGNGTVVALIGVSFLQYAALFVVFAYIAPVVTAGGAFDRLGIPWLLLLFGCGSVAGNLAGGWAADRWGKTQVITAALLALVPILALFPIACGSIAAGSVDAVLWGFAGLAFMAPQQHRVISIPGQAAPVMLSLNVAAIYLGGAAGAALGGAVEHLGANAIGLAGAALALLALALSSLVRPAPAAAN